MLEARDERALLKLERQLTRDGVPHVAVREPDAPWHGQLMAIGLEPCGREVGERHYLRKLQPLGYHAHAQGTSEESETRHG